MTEERPQETLSSTVLARAIGTLSVQDDQAPSRAQPPKSEMNVRSTASSPSLLNCLPPMSSSSNSNSANNTRTASPVGSTSPVFGMPPPTTGTTISSVTPPTSAVSVGSVGPTLVASLLMHQRHHYDLTPVMRNTTGNNNASTGNANRANAAAGNVVSPENANATDSADFLHGEHLSLPADLTAEEEASSHPILPSLRKSSVIQRAQSLSAHHLSASALPGSNDYEPAPPETTAPFPARRFYSFTSREQYKGLQHESDDEEDDDDLSDEESLPRNNNNLTPYQPDRPDFEEESLPPEALRAIFIERRRRNSLRNADDDESQKHHRLLQNPIPMDERTWSIPSLRMAQRLATDGSLASLTDHADEDESFLLLNNNSNVTDEDEASLSSRASSLYMSIGGSTPAALQSTMPLPININMENAPRADATFSSEHTPTIWNDDNSSSMGPRSAATTLSSSFDNVPSFGSHPPPDTKIVLESSLSWQHTQSASTDENSAVAVDGDRAQRRKRKQRQREAAALSWIQSLQQQSNVAVAEAASSKFLTGRTTQAPRTEQQACAVINEETATASPKPVAS